MSETQPEGPTTFESQMTSERIAEHLKHLRQVLRMVNTYRPDLLHKSKQLEEDLQKDLELRGDEALASIEETGVPGGKQIRLG